MINAHGLLEKMYKTFAPVEIDTFDDPTWIGLTPNSFDRSRRESVDELQLTKSSHLGKHVIFQARLCLQKEDNTIEMTLLNAKAAFEAVSNLFFQEE
jgi:hypothetical protein